MDYITYGLFAFAGGLASHLLFNRGPGPFENTIWYGLSQGKRVIVSIDDDAFIFELIGDRLRITRGKSDFNEEEYNGLVADSMVDNGSGESNDSTSDNI